MPRADRGSENLTAFQVDNVWKAAFHAAETGKALNTLVTVNWANLADTSGPTLQERIGRWRERMSKWFKRRGFELTDVWTVERGPKADGLHSHNFLHVPPRHLRDFAAMLPSWCNVEAMSEDELGKLQADRQVQGVKARTVARAVDGVWQVDKVATAERTRVLQYVLKGFDGFAGATSFRGHHAQRRLYGIRPNSQGRVVGKRCGMSHNVGATARKRARLAV